MVLNDKLWISLRDREAGLNVMHFKPDADDNNGAGNRQRQVLRCFNDVKRKKKIKS